MLNWSSFFIISAYTGVIAVFLWMMVVALIVSMRGVVFSRKLEDPGKAFLRKIQLNTDYRKIERELEING